MTPSARLGAFALAVAALFAFASLAEARSGGGGSRGSRTFTPAPATPTAPNAAAPTSRTMTQPGALASRPGAPNAATGAQSRFGGFGGMLMGGLIGAGLFGLLSGAGFGGLGGMLSMLLQVALIGGLIYLALVLFRGRGQQAPAGAATGGGMHTLARDASNMGAQRASTPAGGFLGTQAPPLNVQPADFDTFERLLGRVQDAYGKEDVRTLRELATPEMMSFLAEDLAENAKQGVRNEVSGAKLLQGDLSEAWVDPDAEYATVAMRYSLIDATIDRASGKVVSGDRNAPQEVTEVWTFRRPIGAGADAWKLSEIRHV